MNIDAGIKKLDEIGKCWKYDGWKVTGHDLREILLAGKDPLSNMDEFYVDMEIKNVVNMVASVEKSLGDHLSHYTKTIADMQERIKALESIIKKHSIALDEQLHKPDQKQECKHEFSDWSGKCVYCGEKWGEKPSKSKQDGQTLEDKVAEAIAWWSHSETDVWDEDRQLAVKILNTISSHQSPDMISIRKVDIERWLDRGTAWAKIECELKQALQKSE